MNISEKTINNYKVLSLRGMLNASSAPALKTCVAGFPDEQSIVIDLENVDFLDSSGLGALVGIARKKKASKAIMKLARMNERVKKVFEITQAHTLFDIYDDVSAAADA
ncbi:STAS domain-containing protein [Pelodictyon phaeoclathratiforme]|jgi:anti-sigma B factor antagonist|uniref:Anti-sigma factor antagonist n=1 Tax=Pelodictyon phaeoclathratiforme (strain DSM 5477 / BU-1) TaxID=324925 RepID=B4SFP4_PELPB|nr:STAS domain-containing protein [Pelodictyon phaeoclathratiforme]ACF43299.1 anti-sigma-factor antagonist [Pelodictyon phaeoclathratiforme BU-1]MBV5290339.1 STAS domain-containing protein [Pelodictyon phaeoclathratiforme]